MLDQVHHRYQPHVNTYYVRAIQVSLGITLNLSKTGPSISIGPKGAKYTIGPKGSRTTVGIPGTGAYYTHQTSRSRGKATRRKNPSLIFRTL
jgi:hypothetical protein